MSPLIPPSGFPRYLFGIHSFKLMTSRTPSLLVPILKTSRYSTGGTPAEEGTCEEMTALVRESLEFVLMDMAEILRDAAICSACQRIVHYEIAGYGSAWAYAHELGESDVAAFLQRTLDEQSDADQLLQQSVAAPVRVGATEAAP